MTDSDEILPDEALLGAPLEAVSIYNSIPELIDDYLRYDEQSMLSRILYNRLIDIYTGLTCWMVQNHYRSQIEIRKGKAEVEIDCLYAGVDRTGRQYVIGVEAKSHAKTEMINRVQISNMARLIKQNFPDATPVIMAVKMMVDGTIGMARFTEGAIEPDDFFVKHPTRYKLIRRSGRTDAPPSKQRRGKSGGG